MAPLEHDGDAARTREALDVVGDLVPHALLELRAAGVEIHEPRRAADADQLLGRHVGHERASEEGNEVMDADRVERDVAHHDQLLALGRVRERLEIRLGTGIEPAENLGVELRHALRRLAQLGLGGRIEPQSLNQLGDGALDGGCAVGCPWAQDHLGGIGNGADPRPAPKHGAEDGI